MLCGESSAAERLWYVQHGSVALFRETGDQRGAGVPWAVRRPGQRWRIYRRDRGFYFELLPPVAVDNLRRLLARFVAFLDRTDDWRAPSDHNHARITRVLLCLRDAGLRPEAEAFWRRQLPLPPRGAIVIARSDDGIDGCVMLVPAWAPNQPHRGDVAKLLVHRRARRRGLGRALMAALEAHARAVGLTLLTLDTLRGYCVEVQITNHGAAAVDGWRVVFQPFDARVTQHWNAIGEPGDRAFHALDADWSRRIGPGGTAAFGLCADTTGPAPYPVVDHVGT